MRQPDSLTPLKEFTEWLATSPQEFLSLSTIAEKVVGLFSLQYCSIHVCAEGKWHHFSGTSIGDSALQISDLLKNQHDHPTKLLELAEEEGLGVRYSEIRSARHLLAVVAIKGQLHPDVFNTICHTIGLFLTDDVQIFRSASQKMTAARIR